MLHFQNTVWMGGKSKARVTLPALQNSWPKWETGNEEKPGGSAPFHGCRPHSFPKLVCSTLGTIINAGSLVAGKRMRVKVFFSLSSFYGVGHLCSAPPVLAYPLTCMHMWVCVCVCTWERRNDVCIFICLHTHINIPKGFLLGGVHLWHCFALWCVKPDNRKND